MDTNLIRSHAGQNDALQADINGCRLHVRVQGPVGAPAVLLVHALGANLSIWDEVAQGLARHLRVVRYDLPGHGRSAARTSASPGSAARITIWQMAQEALGVLDALGIRTAHFAGVSVGGMIAQAAAAAAPERILSLVLCHTLARFPDQVREMWRTRAAQVRKQGLAPLADAVISRWMTPAMFARPDSEKWRQVFLATDSEAYAAGGDTIDDCDLRNSTAAITGSTLVLAGDQDMATPPDAVAAMAATIRGADFALLKGVGHLPMIEQPAEVLQAMRDFYRSSHPVAGKSQ